MPDDIQPSMYSRLERVRSILEGHRRLATQLTNTNKVSMRNLQGVKHTYAEPVVAIAKAVMADGADPCLCKREIVLKAACAVFSIPTDGIVRDEAPTNGAGGPKVPPHSHVKRVGTILANWGDKGQLTENKITVTTNAGTLDVSEDCYGIAALLLSKGQGALSCSRERVEEVARQYLAGERVTGLPPFGKNGSNGSAPASEVVVTGAQLRDTLIELGQLRERNRQLSAVREPAGKNGQFDVPVEISIYSLLASAYQLAQLDTSKGGKERAARLEALANDYLGPAKKTASADLA